MARKITFSLVVLVALAASRSLDAQQEYVDFGSRQYVPFGPAATPDWQWFAPVTDAMLSSKPYQGDGYFFGYEHMNWWLSRPDRATIGSTTGDPINAFYSHSYQYLYDDAEQSGRTLVVAPGEEVTMTNSVTIAQPSADRGNGNRYEFGFIQDRWGWMVSVIDDIGFNTTQFYGYDDKRRDQLGAAQGLPGLDGFYTNFIVLINNQPPATDPVAPTASIQALLAIDGLLSVHVLFDDPNGSLSGFIDNDQDGLPDDINGDGIIDDEDLVRFGVTFDDMSVTHQTDLSGVEVTSIRRKRETYHGASVDAFLGVRYLEFDDRMSVLAHGGVMADSAWNNQALNRMVGPQFGFRWHKRTGRWDLGVQGRGMFAANFLRVRLDGKLADHNAPGLLGAPAVPPTAFNHVLNDEKFSPVGELRAEASILLTSKVALKFGWNGMVIGGLSRAANTISYSLPNMGIVEHNEEAFVQGVNFGIEINR